MIRYLLLFICFTSLVMGFSQEVSIYIIGDAGKPKFPDPTLTYLQEITKEASENDVLIFLGDNIYPSGMPSKEAPDRKEMEKRLAASLDVMKAFKGKSYIIPGNHDWDEGGKHGWETLRYMQDFVDEYLGDKGVFMPRNGCPGPLEINLSPTITLVIVDTQYFLHPWDKPGEESDCLAKSTTDALTQLDEILKANQTKHVVVAAHHPIFSDGQHGGKYTLKQHIFPLTDVNRSLWVPLPVLGSIYPGFRSLLGSRQDITNPKYRLIRKTILESASQMDHLIWVNGHEHSLQYIMRDSMHFITSGSGSKSSIIIPGKYSEFAASVHGFGKVTIGGESAQLAFYDGDHQTELFSEELYTKSVQPVQSLVDFDFEDSTVIEPISDRYANDNKQYKYWLGDNYREAWEAPVEMPVFNIGKEHGGLEIVKLGGGNQTKSLRLEAKDGRQYVLRSLDKYTEKLLPSGLYGTLAADVLQDQISAANPYGAFAIPPLADAAGIYHANPKLVYIPDDPRLGNYQQLFAGLPVLYEERPNDEASADKHFGGGEKIEGTPDLIELLHEDNDEVVDQEFALKNRLFDMLIADWDRHEDQWRWVRFDKEPKGHYWRPIPRDRDQAFFVNEGLFGWFASRKFALPNTEGFDEHMDFPPGFNASARFFDRTFLNGLDWEDWKKQIDKLQSELSDQVIQDAFKVWPDTIQQLEAEETARILKARRDDMMRFARIHYEFLSQEVEVVGSNKHEYFLVERLDDQHTRVSVHKRKKDGEVLQELYSRTFDHEITKEVRLYGLRGEDVFELNGETKKGLKIRIIGGEDKDVIDDQSIVHGMSKLTKVYDLQTGTELSTSKETRSKLKDNLNINRYNRTAFEYNKLFPLISAQFNVDDGLFLGAGFMYTKEGWRKDPYAQKHEFKGNAAFATGAINLYYNVIFTDVIGKWDLVGDFYLQRPYAVLNYFGLGNESVYDFQQDGLASIEEDAIDFYRVRYERSKSFIGIGNRIGNKGYFQIGPEHISFEMEDEVSGKYINLERGSEILELQESYQFLGASTLLQADTRNHEHIPTSGVFAKTSFQHYYGLNDRSDDFSKLQAEFRFYLSTQLPTRLTLASRTGFEYTNGQLEYFNASNLGKSNLRGYRRTRFMGNTSFYQNTDVRLRLFSFRTYLFPGTVGLLGFHDIGRVWLDGENSDKWHQSKGAGLWLAPLNQFVFAFNMAFTQEENLPSVTFGFQF